MKIPDHLRPPLEEQLADQSNSDDFIVIRGSALGYGLLGEEEKRNELVVDFIVNNVRIPDQVLGDLLANVTANQVGGQMILDFMTEYGLQSLDQLSHSIRGSSEKAMREAIHKMKAVSYTHLTLPTKA